MDRGQSLKWWGRLQCRHMSRCPDMFWMVCVACLEAGYFDTFKPLGLSVHYCCCSLLVIRYSHDVSITRIPRQQDSNIGDVASFGAGASKRYVRWKMYLQGWRKTCVRGECLGKLGNSPLKRLQGFPSAVCTKQSQITCGEPQRRWLECSISDFYQMIEYKILEDITLILLLYS